MREAGELVEHNVFYIEIFSLKVKKTENEVEMAQKLGSFFGSHTKSLSLKVKEEEEKRTVQLSRLCQGEEICSNVDLLT